MLNIEFLSSPHPFAANCYLISSAGEYAVIDPTVPFDGSLCFGVVKYILLTHAHFDHILEIDSWVEATGAEVLLAESEVTSLSDPMRNCYKLYNGSDRGYFGKAKGLSDGDILPLGDTEIKVIECPGHTVGCAAYLCEGSAFVGDTVFAGGGYGRFDLPGGNYLMLRQSIKKLISLPDEIVFYPGHGSSTTNKQYKQDIGI